VTTRTPATTPPAAAKEAMPRIATPYTNTPSAPLAIGPKADNSPKQVASITPAGAGGSYVVQVGSAKTESEARETFTKMKGKVSALGGQNASYQKAEVNGNDIVRIRLAPSSKESATELCSSIKSGGGNCFITKL
jgi:cell division septation protein DedD